MCVYKNMMICVYIESSRPVHKDAIQPLHNPLGKPMSPLMRVPYIIEPLDSPLITRRFNEEAKQHPVMHGCSDDSPSAQQNGPIALYFFGIKTSGLATSDSLQAQIV